MLWRSVVVVGCSAVVSVAAGVAAAESAACVRVVFASGSGCDLRRSLLARCRGFWVRSVPRVQVQQTSALDVAPDA